jgi:hypothetical protein
LFSDKAPAKQLSLRPTDPDRFIQGIHEFTQGSIGPYWRVPDIDDVHDGHLDPFINRAERE